MSLNLTCTGAAAAVVLTTIAATAGASERLWSYASGAESWVGRAISLADHGTQVLAEFDGINGASRLLSGFDAASPTPIWQFNQPMLTAYPAVDASDRADVHAVLVHQTNTNTPGYTPTIYVHRSSGFTPVFTYDFPMTVSSEANGLHVTNDGNRVLGWVFDGASGRTRVTCLRVSTGTVLWSELVQTYGQPLSSVLSRDGTRLALMGNIVSSVLDVSTGGVVGGISNVSSIAPAAHSVSLSGTRLAKARYQRYIELWDSNSSGYAYVRMIDLGADKYPFVSLLSDDSSTLFVASAQGTLSRTVVLQVFHLADGSSTPVYSDTIVGSGAFPVWATGMALSDRGDVLCVGTTGDETGAVPEALAYRKNSAGTWERFWSHDLPGSALDIDLSGDGKHVAIGSKSVHAVVMAGGGQIDLFRLGDADLSGSGVPRLGATTQVRFKTTPNAPCALLVSDRFVGPSEGPNPTLQLGRSNTRILAVGLSDSAGSFARPVQLTSAALAVLNDPSTPQDEAAELVQVGKTVYVQAVRLTPRRLSADVVTLTILPQ